MAESAYTSMTFNEVGRELRQQFGITGDHHQPVYDVLPDIGSDVVTRKVKLSVGEILRMAADMYVQISAHTAFDDFTSLLNQYNSNISAEDNTEIELIQLLLTAAESVGNCQYELATLLISHCRIASDSGNAVMRLVFYFSKALQQRVDLVTGKIPPEKIDQQTMNVNLLQHDSNLSYMEFHQKIPFSKAMQFAAIQAIIDNVKTAKKIHVVDIHIRSGIQWTVLMQVLAELEELPTLKISALATTSQQQHVEEASKRLQSFAQSLNLPFTFNIVSVSDMKELRDGMFKREIDETVVVYSSIILRTMISNPKSLGHLMKRIKLLKPSIVVVTEVEANHNSTSFISRFTESLFFFGAYFDSLEDCMDRDSKNRKIIEGSYFGEGIKNIVASQGDKRCNRNVEMTVWREFFSWYNMREVQLSKDAMRQANMVVEKFSTGKSCTFTSNGKGILIRWKGTPIHSLSTWKFS